MKLPKMFRRNPKPNFYVGQKVEITRLDIINLKKRKHRTGFITSIGGSLINVRPTWCNWEVELYPNEIKPIEISQKKE